MDLCSQFIMYRILQIFPQQVDEGLLYFGVLCNVLTNLNTFLLGGLCLIAWSGSHIGLLKRLAGYSRVDQTKND